MYLFILLQTTNRIQTYQSSCHVNNNRFPWEFCSTTWSLFNYHSVDMNPPLSLVNRLFDTFSYYSIKVSPSNTKFCIIQLLNQINYAREFSIDTIHDMKMCACVRDWCYASAPGIVWDGLIIGAAARSWNWLVMAS